MNVFDLVQVYISIQSSGKPIEHFEDDDQFKHLSGIYLSYIFIFLSFIIYIYNPPINF